MHLPFNKMHLPGGGGQSGGGGAEWPNWAGWAQKCLQGKRLGLRKTLDSGQPASDSTVGVRVEGDLEGVVVDGECDGVPGMYGDGVGVQHAPWSLPLSQ